MPRGQSGRIVLEIDPAKKRHLYAALDDDGMTLKEWFMARLERYVERQQHSLFETRSDDTNEGCTADDGDG